MPTPGDLPRRSTYTAPLAVRVFGPETPISSTPLAEVLGAQDLSRARRERLERCPKIVILGGERPLGYVAYERVGDDFRVHEFGCIAGADCSLQRASELLLDTIELAALAGGGRRVVLTPKAPAPTSVLTDRGYSIIQEGCAGSWFQKTLP